MFATALDVVEICRPTTSSKLFAHFLHSLLVLRCGWNVGNYFAFLIRLVYDDEADVVLELLLNSKFKGRGLAESRWCGQRSRPMSDAAAVVAGDPGVIQPTFICLVTDCASHAS